MSNTNILRTIRIRNQMLNNNVIINIHSVCLNSFRREYILTAHRNEFTKFKDMYYNLVWNILVANSSKNLVKNLSIFSL